MNLLSETNATDETKADILTSIDEAFSNIVFHAYKGREDGIIEIRVVLENRSFKIIFVDYADTCPLPVGKPALGKALMERKGSLGLGVYIMKQLMDHVHYKRIGQTNQLTLIKNFI